VTAAALGLVAAAALSHACWNLLVKRSGDPVVFFWWTGIAGTLLFLPVVLVATPGWGPRPGIWTAIALSAVIRATYLATLGTAYTRGDLSLVYPLARGLAPVLVPPLAVVILGERPTPVGWLAILTVAIGVYVLHLPGLGTAQLLTPLAALREPHARWAAVTALMTASYSILDKWSMAHGVPPLLYAYLTIPGAALLLTPLVLARRRAGAAGGGRPALGVVALVALLMTAGYLLVLQAMRLAPVSYVAAARELGIVFGTVLGSVALAERHLPPRLAGAALIVLGVLLLAA
jgi:drug/metabolite transporter (DMT)-like permease